MKKAVVLLAILAILAAVLAPAFASSGCRAAKTPAKSGTKATVKKPVSAICPVMGTRIPDVSKAAGKSVYKGKTYYFCCPACKPKFDKNPAKYVKSKPPAKK